MSRKEEIKDQQKDYERSSRAVSLLKEVFDSAESAEETVKLRNMAITLSDTAVTSRHHYPPIITMTKEQTFGEELKKRLIAANLLPTEKENGKILAEIFILLYGIKPSEKPFRWVIDLGLQIYRIIDIKLKE